MSDEWFAEGEVQHASGWPFPDVQKPKPGDIITVAGIECEVGEVIELPAEARPAPVRRHISDAAMALLEADDMVLYYEDSRVRVDGVMLVTVEEWDALRRGHEAALSLAAEADLVRIPQLRAERSAALARVAELREHLRKAVSHWISAGEEIERLRALIELSARRFPSPRAAIPGNAASLLPNFADPRMGK